MRAGLEMGYQPDELANPIPGFVWWAFLADEYTLISASGA